MQFPRLGYKSAAVHKLVHDESEFNAALDRGFFASVPEAIEGKSAEKAGKPQDDAPPTREELEAKATELGIKFDGRTGDAKLGKLIAEAIKD